MFGNLFNVKGPLDLINEMDRKSGLKIPKGKSTTQAVGEAYKDAIGTLSGAKKQKKNKKK